MFCRFMRSASVPKKLSKSLLIYDGCRQRDWPLTLLWWHKSDFYALDQSKNWVSRWCVKIWSFKIFWVHSYCAFPFPHLIHTFISVCWGPAVGPVFWVIFKMLPLSIFLIFFPLLSTGFNHNLSNGRLFKRQDKVAKQWKRLLKVPVEGKSYKLISWNII